MEISLLPPPPDKTTTDAETLHQCWICQGVEGFNPPGGIADRPTKDPKNGVVCEH